MTGLLIRNVEESVTHRRANVVFHLVGWYDCFLGG